MRRSLGKAGCYSRGVSFERSLHQSDGYELTDGHQTYGSFHADARKDGANQSDGCIHSHAFTK